MVTTSRTGAQQRLPHGPLGWPLPLWPREGHTAHMLPTMTDESLASWLIDKVREVKQHTQAATRADVASLTSEVCALREKLFARDSEGVLP